MPQCKNKKTKYLFVHEVMTLLRYVQKSRGDLKYFMCFIWLGLLKGEWDPGLTIFNLVTIFDFNQSSCAQILMCRPQTVHQPEAFSVFISFCKKKKEAIIWMRDSANPVCTAARHGRNYQGLQYEKSLTSEVLLSKYKIVRYDIIYHICL